jgi:dihydroneopterin aldolase
VELNTGDRIRINQLEIFARLGVTGDERARPQRVVLGVTAWPKADFDRLEDDIAQTVNYVELCRATRDFVDGREWNLIETLASTLASHLLTKFPLRIVEIEVRKFVLPNTEYVSATVRRGR